ncbi:MAG TPA: IclR family transcriptional regulator [Firmicutes bacterium]|jgi:DNA-binding IclR family transcriptional regulator|nr:IclR family transcriptional regulator [Bacillota bacterium]
MGKVNINTTEKKDKGDRKSKYLIKSVIKAFQIMETMSKPNEEIRIKDLAAAMDMEQSTIHRFLLTLEHLGYVEQTEKNGKYRLSLKLFEVGSSLIHSLDLHSQTSPVLHELNKRFGETVHLVVLDKGEAVFVNKLATFPTLVTYSYIGKRCHAHCIASGKVLLAHLTPGEFENIIREKGLPQFTANTLTDVEELKKHMVEIRKEGLAYDFGELEPLVNCVAAPVKNHAGQVIAAVSVSGPASRLDLEKLKKIGSEVKETVDTISQKLGYSQPWGH